MLEYPIESSESTLPGNDFKDFITSFSIHPTHLAYAYYLCQLPSLTPKSRVLQSFSHAALLECLTLDKPEILPAHIELHLLRMSHPDNNPLFGLQLENLMFATVFYLSIFDRKFNPRSDHERSPLIRISLLLAVLQNIDETIRSYTSEDEFKRTFAAYCMGETLEMSIQESHRLAAYLVRESVPYAPILVELRKLTQKAYDEASFEPGDSRVSMVHQAIRSVLHETACQISTPVQVNKWSLRSLEEVIEVWGFPPVQG